MSIKSMQFRTIASKPKGVDVAARRITGVVVMELGKIQDYRAYHLDQDFADALIKSATKQKKGVMSNFGHNWDNLGKRLGRISNFTQEGNKVVADIEVFESADKSPGYPGMGTYVLEMAQEDPEAIMLSINFSYKYQFQKMKDGTEFKVNYWDSENFTYIYPNPALGDVYLKFDELASVDAVDKGAATNQFFSDKGELAAAAHEVFSHEDLAEVFKMMPVELQKKITDLPGKRKAGLFSEIKSLLGLSGDAVLSNNPTVETVGDVNLSEMENEKLSALNTQIADLTEQLAAVQAEKDALTQSNADLGATNTALSAKVTSFEQSLQTALSRIEALEKKPAASHTTGDEADEETKDVPLYLQNPINAKFAKKD